MSNAALTTRPVRVVVLAIRLTTASRLIQQPSRAPVLGDEAEQPVLDFIPLAGAGRKVTDHQPHSQIVGQALQADLPKPAARAVAAAAIGGDQHFTGPTEAAAAHACPPATDTVGGEVRRVVVDPDADPALIIANIVNAVGNHLPQRLVCKVMYSDRLGLALRAPLAPCVLEIPDQFLLFRVDRHGRLAAMQAVSHTMPSML